MSLQVLSYVARSRSLRSCESPVVVCCPLPISADIVDIICRAPWTSSEPLRRRSSCAMRARWTSRREARAHATMRIAADYAYRRRCFHHPLRMWRPSAKHESSRGNKPIWFRSRNPEPTNQSFVPIYSTRVYSKCHLSFFIKRSLQAPRGLQKPSEKLNIFWEKNFLPICIGWLKSRNHWVALVPIKCYALVIRLWFLHGFSCWRFFRVAGVRRISDSSFPY